MFVSQDSPTWLVCLYAVALCLWCKGSCQTRHLSPCTASWSNQPCGVGSWTLLWKLPYSATSITTKWWLQTVRSNLPDFPQYLCYSHCRLSIPELGVPLLICNTIRNQSFPHLICSNTPSVHRLSSLFFEIYDQLTAMMRIFKFELIMVVAFRGKGYQRW